MGRRLAIGIVLMAAVSGAAAPVELIYTYSDQREERQLVLVEPDAAGVLRLTLKRSELPAGVVAVEVLPEFARATRGEPGYYVTPDGFLGTFRLAEGSCTVNVGRNYLPIYGMQNPRATFVGIVVTQRFEYDLRIRAHQGVYTIAPRFNLAGYVSSDDLTVEWHLLAGRDANYAGMARTYRRYQLARGEVQPIKERMQHQPELAAAANSLEIRIRQGWKPAPSPVLEQTLETEPPMKAVVSFDRVGDIIDALKAAGVDRAELCLVGWNQKGHDGRWPQIFPVEEGLGGEERLRPLIQKARRLGFQIVGHTNSSDGYHIADCWDPDLAAKRADGTPFTNAVWSGGQMYALCPQRVWERFYPRDIEQVAELGFRGLHYIDVISILPPPVCHDPRHPLTRKESAAWFDRILAACKDHLGGVASEGPFDFAAGNLDYVLYVYFGSLSGQHNPLHDRLIPIWQLVYNGIILNNPFTESVNPSTKDRTTQLKLVEFGGRPIYYFYSQFREDNSHWMGKTDLRCGTADELAQAVAAIKAGYDEFEPLRRLQFEFMDEHDQLAPEVFRTGYADGTAVITNYGETDYDYQGHTVPARSYRVVR